MPEAILRGRPLRANGNLVNHLQRQPRLNSRHERTCNLGFVGADEGWSWLVTNPRLEANGAEKCGWVRICEAIKGTRGGGIPGLPCVGQGKSHAGEANRQGTGLLRKPRQWYAICRPAHIKPTPPALEAKTESFQYESLTLVVQRSVGGRHD